jgi:hypothetical protein
MQRAVATPLFTHIDTQTSSPCYPLRLTLGPNTAHLEPHNRSLTLLQVPVSIRESGLQRV